MKEDNKPTQEQIRLCAEVIKAQKEVDRVRPVVEVYEQAILDEHKFLSDARWDMEGSKVITERRKAYLMSDSDFDTYHAETVKAYQKAGLTVDKPDSDPLLEREHKLLLAERDFLDSMAPMHKFESKVLNSNLKVRGNVLKLSMDYLRQFVTTKFLLS